MSATRLPKLCMFCGRDESYGEMNREDFVPRGLWEDGKRPPAVKTVPAHKKCNESFSQDNEYFRDVLALEEGASVRCKAAKDVSDGAIQRKFKRRFGSLAKNIKSVQITAVTTRSGIVYEYRPAFEVDWKRIETVLFNVMKGIFFTVKKSPMPADYHHWIQDIRLLHQAPLERVISDMTPWQSFGDDAFACRYRFLHRPDVVGMDCLLQFYRNRCFFGQAVSPEYARNHMAHMFIPDNAESQILVPYWVADQNSK